MSVMEHNSIVMSFMIRCSLEANGRFRVLTRNIANGEERQFISLEDAAGYIKRQLREVQTEPPDRKA